MRTSARPIEGSQTTARDDSSAGFNQVRPIIEQKLITARTVARSAATSDAHVIDHCRKYGNCPSLRGEGKIRLVRMPSSRSGTRVLLRQGDAGGRISSGVATAAGAEAAASDGSAGDPRLRGDAAASCAASVDSEEIIKRVFPSCLQIHRHEPRLIVGGRQLAVRLAPPSGVKRRNAPNVPARTDAWFS
ncbi:MAG: hypothetical protein DCC67_01285 [Planctomycetota bacterium]|nr:MAG: hypothetical protein DCC67_01285 [Planctomycetota bacterium]